MNEFRLGVLKAKEFGKLMDAIGALADRVILHISKEMFTLKAMDPSHVAMVCLELPNQWFKEWICKRAQEIPIDVTELNKVLKKAADEELYLSRDAADNKFCLTLIETKWKRTFRIGIYSDVEESDGKPNVDYRACFSIDPADLFKIIESAGIVGDYITLTLSNTDQYLTIASFGEFGDFSGSFNEFIGNIDVTGIQSSTYSLELLKVMMKARDLAEKATLEFATELPLKLEFKLRDQAKLVYTLAPRVEEEDAEDADEESE